jgi:hypothetical protein
MSKGRPFTPKATPDPAAGGPPAAPATCSACKFWRDDPAAGPAVELLPGHGFCTAGPPTVQVALGPVFGYGQTPADLPACGAAVQK